MLLLLLLVFLRMVVEVGGLELIHPLTLLLNKRELVLDRLLQTLDIDLVFDHFLEQMARSTLPVVERLGVVAGFWMEL